MCVFLSPLSVCAIALLTDFSASHSGPRESSTMRNFTQGRLASELFASCDAH